MLKLCNIIDNGKKRLNGEKIAKATKKCTMSGMLKCKYTVKYFIKMRKAAEQKVHTNSVMQ